jgi:hypothetical protein
MKVLSHWVMERRERDRAREKEAGKGWITGTNWGITQFSFLKAFVYKEI